MTAHCKHPGHVYRVETPDGCPYEGMDLIEAARLLAAQGIEQINDGDSYLIAVDALTGAPCASEESTATATAVAHLARILIEELRTQEQKLAELRAKSGLAWGLVFDYGDRGHHPREEI